MPISRISGKIKNRKYSRAQNDNSFSYSKPQSFKKRIKSAHFKTVNVHILEKLPSKNSQNFKSCYTGIFSYLNLSSPNNAGKM